MTGTKAGHSHRTSHKHGFINHPEAHSAEMLVTCNQSHLKMYIRFVLKQSEF